MKKNILYALFIFFLSPMYAQDAESYVLNLNVNDIANQLKLGQPLFSGVPFDEKPRLMFPIYDGTLTEFTFEKAPILHPDMQSDYPDIQSYFLQSTEDPALMARVNISPEGLFAIFKKNGKMSVIKNIQGQTANFQYEGRLLKSADVNCQLAEELGTPESFPKSTQLTNSCFQNGSVLRTFRLAFGVTWEYADFFGGTLASVNAQIVNDLSALNLIYETELAITFQLAASNDILTNIILNANTASDDPFTDPDYTNISTTLNEASDFFAANMDNADFDIGHLFNITTGTIAAGISGIGVVCENTVATSFKGRGYSILRPVESYQLPAHEIGHQFSARHTNYGCSTNNKCQRYEPGQGTTLMSTRANCTTEDDYGAIVSYFNVGTIQGILDFVTTGDAVFGNASCAPSSTTRGMCAATTLTGNNVPNANANPQNASYTIPKLTPFQLIGEGTDVDGDVLSYNWEQYDSDYEGSLLPDDAGNSGTTTDPLFRSLPPSASPERICPRLSSILNTNNTAGTGEDLPEESRTMNWRFTVRDNFAGASAMACDELSITVDASAGPFLITSQNTATNWLANGSNIANVTWDVAGTNGGSINCATVDIELSVDGGLTFPYTLASGVTNDGSQIFIIPSYPTNAGRVRVRCSDNIFFDINDAPISISSSCVAFGSTISPDVDVVADQGDPALNLNVSPDYGNVINSFAGTITTSDAPSNLSVDDATGNCFGPANANYYDRYDFVVNAAGDYTFTINTGTFGLVLNLYETDYDDGSVCANWLGSTGEVSGGTANIYSSMDIAGMSPGVNYVLVVSSYTTSFPALPDNYAIGVSGAGNAFDGAPPPDSNTFDYTYVVVDSMTNQIVGFESTADLSNGSNYPGSLDGTTYLVYGLSYVASADLSVYVGTDFDAFSSDLVLLVFCGNLSSNSIEVGIINSCPPNFAGLNALTGNEAANPIIYKTAGTLESTQNILPGANVCYGSEIEVILNIGFQVDPNADFKADVGPGEGCN